MKNAEVNSPKGFCSNRTMRVHTCKIAMDAVDWVGANTAPHLFSGLHPAYSPDLAPSDYFLFPNLKKDIRGRHFRPNEEVVVAVEEWVRDKGPGFFSSGLMALEQSWSKCIILEGNYIEQEDHHGPISLTSANRFAYLLLKFQPSSLL